MNLQEPKGNDDVCLPRKTFVEMIETFEKMESLIATMEILADKETMKNLKESREDIKNGRFLDCKPEDLEKIMNDDSIHA
jgi:hypothetical protein